MRVLVLHHHYEDDPGLIGEELIRRGATLTLHHVLEYGPLPNAQDFDFVVLLGANYSVYDLENHGHWIEPELDWLRQANEDGISVLGICFGAQALAVAHGGSVEKSPKREIGWVSITDGDPSVASGPWFEFHSDRIFAPQAATVLASNDVCVQAFRIGKNLAVQFHPEVDRRQLQAWFNNAEGLHDEVEDYGLNVQELLAETEQQSHDAKPRIERLVDYFFNAANGS